jgi:hypothetical protein
MLYAIRHNKAGRNLNNEEINWRHLFKTSEDSLTSMVFGRLLYLPHELFWNIIRESCYGNDLPSYSGPTIAKEFWPSWDASNTSNSTRVEPDVFIQFQHFDLIIEAKRWDSKQQSKSQWVREIMAYKNEYEDSDKKLYFIALGGLFDETTEILETVTVLKCRWIRILEKVIDYHKRLIDNSRTISPIDSAVSILSDLILVFQLHGYATGEWFSKIPIKEYRIGDALDIIACNKLKFDLEIWLNSIPTRYKIVSTII